MALNLYCIFHSAKLPYLVWNQTRRKKRGFLDSSKRTFDEPVSTFICMGIFFLRAGSIHAREIFSISGCIASLFFGFLDLGNRFPYRGKKGRLTKAAPDTEDGPLLLKKTGFLCFLFVPGFMARKTGIRSRQHIHGILFGG